MCCSFGIHNSSHSRTPCLAADDSMSSAQHAPLRAPPDCLLRIPAGGRRQRPPAAYELVSCAGHSVSLVCEANLSCSDRGVSWKRASDGRTFRGRDLRLPDVQRRDSGTYLCEVTDYFGKLRLGAQVNVAVQFPPQILVPNHSLSSDRLECKSEANPTASITWYRDDVPLLSPTAAWYTISSETTDCTTSSLLRLLNASSLHPFQNYTCVASNEHGQSAATLFWTAPTEESSGDLPDEKRRFNVTGFIVGMLPPLFISFYIILKLGYRSRYAEERGEDDGFREEPFFISY